MVCDVVSGGVVERLLAVPQREMGSGNCHTQSAERGPA